MDRLTAIARILDTGYIISHNKPSYEILGLHYDITKYGDAVAWKVKKKGAWKRKCVNPIVVRVLYSDYVRADTIEDFKLGNVISPKDNVILSPRIKHYLWHFHRYPYTPFEYFYLTRVEQTYTPKYNFIIDPLSLDIRPIYTIR